MDNQRLGEERLDKTSRCETGPGYRHPVVQVNSATEALHQ
jgi:hypothetical protein